MTSSTRHVADQWELTVCLGEVPSTNGQTPESSRDEIPKKKLKGDWKGGIQEV